MSELDLNQIEELASNLRAVSDETYSAAVAVADVYNTTSSYDIGDYCIKSTLLYKCNTAIPSGEVWNSNHWDEICISDELNEIRNSVIHVGTSAPSNPNVQLWLDTDEPGMSGVSSVNGATGTVVLDADDVGAMHWDLLWENASPSSSFAAQTIQVDSSGYDFLLFEVSAEAYNYMSPFMLVSKKSIAAENNIRIRGIAGYSYFISRAILSITDTSIQFDVATTATSFNTNGSTNNACIIPKYIWGIKGVVTA